VTLTAKGIFTTEGTEHTEKDLSSALSVCSVVKRVVFIPRGGCHKAAVRRVSTPPFRPVFVQFHNKKTYFFPVQSVLRW